jgi:hypothetical protein
MMRILAVIESRAENTLPMVLEYALRQIAAGTEIIVVSTRPVDLSDAEQFESSFSDPHHRRLASQIRTIDTSSEKLKHYFEVDS